MSRPPLIVQHFVACTTIVPIPGGPEIPYNLMGVRYTHEVPGVREWPAQLDDLWFFVRFFNGSGTRFFEIDFVWLDGPNGRQLLFTLSGFQVQFERRHTVASRAFHIGSIRFPGPGRYLFQLHRLGLRRMLAREVIQIKRRP